MRGHGAYIDPASGTLLLQLLLVGAIGVVAFFRRSIKLALIRLLGRGRATGADGVEAPDHRD